MSYYAESHLESCETSTMEVFSEDSQQSYDFDYFLKKAALYMFDWIPNAPPTGKGALNAGCW